MKVTVKQIEKKVKIKYPYLAETPRGRVILLTETCKGVVLKDPTGKYPIGQYSANWGEEHFRPFEGELTFSND